MRSFTFAAAALSAAGLVDASPSPSKTLPKLAERASSLPTVTASGNGTSACISLSQETQCNVN